MTDNPIIRLIRSRKFLLLLLDVVLSSALYLAGKYAAPQMVDDVKLLIGLWQPVFVSIIVAISVEDAAQARAWVDAQREELSREVTRQPRVIGSEGGGERGGA